MKPLFGIFLPVIFHRQSVLTALLAVMLLGALGFAPPLQAQSDEQVSPERLAYEMRRRAKLHTELAALYFQEGNLAVASEELRIALAADAAYPAAYNMRGLVNFYLREYEAAEADLKKALDFDPTDPEISNNYGWFLCQRGRAAESIPHFLRALKQPLYSTPERAYQNAGQCSLKAGEVTAAEDFLIKAQRLFREPNAQVTLGLAEVRYRRGQTREARQLMSDAVRQGDVGAAGLALAARIERAYGDRAAEASYLSQLKKRYPESRELQELMKELVE